MSSDVPVPGKTTLTNITLKGPSFELTFQARVPVGPTKPRQLLPLAHALSEVMVRQAQDTEEQAGRRISCASGCGACCRSLVAISEIEARQIAELVTALPEPRRAVIQGRFANARASLRASGLLELLEAAESWEADDYGRMVTKYFAAGIPCPFLEDESCSIYIDRPLTCREFLVTSPPHHCAELGSRAVVPVKLPMKVFNAVARWQKAEEGAFEERWVPLILAPDWAASHPDQVPPQEGLELLRELLAHMAEQDEPPPNDDA